MSIEVTALVLRARTGLGTQAKMVLLGLADHARADGTEARPGVRTLARYAECSDRTVQRHLRALEDAGLISVQRRHNPKAPSPTVWRIALARLAALGPGDTLSPPQPVVVVTTAGTVEAGSLEGVTLSPPGDARVTPPVTIGRGGGDTAVSPEPSEATVLEPSNPRAASPRDRDEAWDDLVELYGEPVNDADSDRRNRAVRLCRQAGWVEGELAALVAFARRDPRSWVCNLVATDMALAANLGRLRRERAGAADPDVDLIERVRARTEAVAR